MEAFEEAVEAIKVGDPLDEATEMGPLISAGQRETVASFVPEGAPVAIRGSAPDGPGYWFPPTVLCPVDPGDRAVREEIFGPVAVVIPFRDEEEAVALANDTIYGLSGLGVDARRRQGAAGRARARDRRDLGQLEHVGAGGDAVRRLQAVGRRARARAARARALLRGQDRLLRDGRMSRLARKVCVITGAAGGIGSASVERFQDEGATVVGVDLTDDSPGDLAIAGRRHRRGRRPRAVSRASATEFGTIDVLFNNAGISPTDDASVLDTSLEAWQRVQDVNLQVVFLCCKHGIPHLLETGGGSVINTASFVAVMGAATSQISYTASKGGVLALVARARRSSSRAAACASTRSAPARSTRRCCGSSTPTIRRRPRGGWCTCRWGASRRRSSSPTRRLFLASDEASYVTASTFLVDGGLAGAYVTPL